MKEDIKGKAVNGVFWRFLERFGAQGVAFIVSIVLARLLDPEIYGTISLVLVFTTILQVFVDGGLGNALIQNKDSNKTDFSTVFYFNIVLGLVVYAIIWFVAPLIASFYNRVELTSIIRVLSISVIIGSIKNVQQAYVSKHMMFKKFFYSTLSGTIGAALVGITLAYFKFGVWALVAQHLFNLFIDTLILWFTVKWRPTKEFSFKRLKILFSYGWKLLASSLLHTVYTNLRSLIIGKKYTSEDLAYFSKGESFPSMITTSTNASIDSVLLPAMSKVQDDKEVVKAMTRKSIMISSYLIVPLMTGLAMIAGSLIELLLTEKWNGAVIFLRIACLSFALEPLQTANLNAIKAIGRSDIYFKLEVIKKVISITILLLSINYGVEAIAVSSAIYSVIALIINMFPNRKLLGYGYIEQIKDLFPSLIMSLIMAAIIYPIILLNLHPAITLTIQVFGGVSIYCLLSYFTNAKPFYYLLDAIKNMKKGKK